MHLNVYLSIVVTCLSRRLVSTKRICDIRATALTQSTIPADTRYLFSFVEVVSGIIRQTFLLNPLNINTGREKSLPVPSCSKPTLAPRRHQRTCRSWYSGR